MSARPSLFDETVAQKIALRVWASWASSTAGLAEAAAVVEAVVAGRFPKWVRLGEVAEILRLAAEMENE